MGGCALTSPDLFSYWLATRDKNAYDINMQL